MAELGLDRAAFRPSYRPEKRPDGLDPEMKRMGVMAAGIGGVMALLVGGAWLVRPAHHGVPVVEAETGPVRIKPENPGGMQVSGSDFGAPSASGPHLAPAAEAPQISALQAKVRSMQQEIAKQRADNEEALKVAQAARAAAAQQKLAAAQPKVAGAAPVQRASATAVVPAVETALPGFAEAPAIAGTKGTQVQFAAFTDEASARAEWDGLMKKTPELLGGRRPDITRADAAGRTMWRLRTGGFSSVADAAGFCAKMRAKGSDCSIAAF